MKHSLGILAVLLWSSVQIFAQTDWYNPCLLYTSDAADEL